MLVDLCAGRNNVLLYTINDICGINYVLYGID